MRDIRTPRLVTSQPVRCCGVAREHQAQASLEHDPRDPRVVSESADPVPPAAVRLSVVEVLERLDDQRGRLELIAGIHAWAAREGVDL